MSKFDAMGKEQLRSACRAAGISYGKLTNDGMRAALNAAALPQEEEEQVETKPSTLASLVQQISGANTKNEAEKAPAVAKRASNGLKIEKDREERNGVKRPSAGGTCRAVWDALDAAVAAGKTPSAKDVKALAELNGWNPNNASIEFYQWRKFNGIRGRQ